MRRRRRSSRAICPWPAVARSQPRGHPSASISSVSTGRGRGESASGRAACGGAGVRGVTRRRRPRTGPTPGPQSARVKAAGSSAIRTGPAPRTGSSTGCAAASTGCVPTTSGARSTRRLRVRSPAPRRPAIVTRSAWRASESIRRGAPRYASALRFAVVHHSAGSNSYTKAQSPAVVRAIQLYHVRGNGWDDVGYNFLVDRYGQVFEGRFGGIERNVIGAHAQGFNTGSVGVALLGNYDSIALSAAGAQRARAVARLAPRRRPRRPAHRAQHALRAATRAFRPAFPSCCARSPVTATSASRAARARSSTASSTCSPGPSRSRACPSSTRRRRRSPAGASASRAG